jgi:hypothetical protein
MKRVVFLLVCVFGLVCSCDDRSGALFDELSPSGGSVDGDSVAIVFSFGREGYIPISGKDSSSSSQGVLPVQRTTNGLRTIRLVFTC